MEWEDPYGGGCSTSAYCPGSSGPIHTPSPQPEPETDSILDRIESGPDYISVTLMVPIIEGFIGPGVTITHDRYDNWFWAPGGGITFGHTVSLNFGWLLRNETPSEHELGNLISQHSFFGGGGFIIGAGLSNGDPSYAHPENSHYQSQMEDIALEVQLTSPGVVGGATYGMWIYDTGDPTPWFWQDHDNVNDPSP